VADSRNGTYRRASDGKFVVDGAYLRDQARTAVKTFVAPFSGVYSAARGGGALSQHRPTKASKRES